MESFERSLGFRDNLLSMHVIKGWEVDVHSFWRQLDVFATMNQYSVSRERQLKCVLGQFWLRPALSHFSHGSSRRPNLVSTRERPRAELTRDMKIEKLQEGFRGR